MSLKIPDVHIKMTAVAKMAARQETHQGVTMNLNDLRIEKIEDTVVLTQRIYGGGWPNDSTMLNFQGYGYAYTVYL